MDIKNQMQVFDGGGGTVGELTKTSCRRVERQQTQLTCGNQVWKLNQEQLVWFYQTFVLISPTNAAPQFL